MTATNQHCTGDAELLSRAAQVLRDNDLGHMIKAGPDLYPHQWSWDAAFVTIGLAQLSVPRALDELRTVLAGQWRTGMLPHIIFSGQPGYFPDFEDWGAADASALPPGVRSSGICQPPVHAIALELVLHQARRDDGVVLRKAVEFAAEAVPKLASWHNWLSTARGHADVVEIHHGWESGMDNSPRWDEVYAGVEVSRRLDFERTDLIHADASERPSDEEYQRYITLIEQMKSVHFDDLRVKEVLDFRVTDVFFSAILVLAAESLARIAEKLGQHEIARTEQERAERTRAGVLATIDPISGLCRDYDINAGRWLGVESMGGFAAVLLGGDDAQTVRQREILRGRHWCAHPEMAFWLPPTVSLDSTALRPREYWRGPVWPVMNWLFAWTALRSGQFDDARRWRRAGLDQLRDLSFGEYYEPRTGESLGSSYQSWSAMAAVDWLSNPIWTACDSAG